MKYAPFPSLGSLLGRSWNHPVWLYLTIATAGVFFSWKLVAVPTRLETAALTGLAVAIPSLRFPKLALYYLMSFTCLVPLIRRAYYLLQDRPSQDILMLITDGVLLSMYTALIMLWVKNRTKSRDRLSWLVFALTLWMFLKVFLLNSNPILYGLYAFKFTGLYALLFFGASSLVPDKDSMKPLVFFGTAVLFATSLYGIKQMLFGLTEFEYLWIDAVRFTSLFIDDRVRIFSTYVSPAAFSDAMTIQCLLGLYYMVTPNPSSRLFGLMAFTAAVPGLLFATVRSNWIAALAGLLIFILLKTRLSWKLLLALLLIIPGFSLLDRGNTHWQIESQTAVMQRQLNTGGESLADVMIRDRAQALLNPFAEYSFQQRLVIWKQIWDEVKFRHPLGKGLGTFDFAHSFYVEMFGELGYLGIGCILGILGMVFYRARVVLKFEENVETRDLACVLLAVFLTICILNITGPHTGSHPADLYFWLSAGLITTLYRRLPARDPASRHTPKS